MAKPIDGVDVRWNYQALPKFSNTKPRYAIGVAVSAQALVASLVRALGRGTNLICDVLEQRTRRLSDQVVEALAAPSVATSFNQMEQARGECTDVTLELIRPLVANSHRHHDDVLAIGFDVGLWRTDPTGRTTHTSLCDAARLAEISGLTVIDDLPARDLGAGRSRWANVGLRRLCTSRGSIRFAWRTISRPNNH